MPNKHSGHPHPRRWLAALFLQPPKGFYRMPAVYLSGNRMEIPSVCRVWFPERSS